MWLRLTICSCQFFFMVISISLQLKLLLLFLFLMKFVKTDKLVMVLCLSGLNLMEGKLNKEQWQGSLQNLMMPKLKIDGRRLHLIPQQS